MLASLFYPTGDCHRFSHRGEAQFLGTSLFALVPESLATDFFGSFCTQLDKGRK